MLRRFYVLCVGALALGSSTLLADWRPINPSELALKQSTVEAGADAEALFREVRITNEVQGRNYPKNIVSEYVRLKIFTERGKELGKVQLPFYGKQQIFGVQGRTILPNGTSVELNRNAVFSKVLEKRGYKTKVVTFAMPAVVPGSIIEYRFSKDYGEITSRYQPLEVQSEYPVDEVTFLIKPLSSIYADIPMMRYVPFDCTPERGPVTRDGFETILVRHVPAFHDEPYSLPRFSAKQWILVYYEENSKSGKDQYWTSLGKQYYRDYIHEVKVNGELKTLATQIMGDAATDTDKLDRLLKYCRTVLKDTSNDEVKTADLADSKANKNTLDTIHNKLGTAGDISYAFLALAEAAGYQARRADLSSRASFLFTGAPPQSGYFLNAFCIAVNVDGAWRFYDVTNRSVPGGQLSWPEQGVYALVTDDKHPEMVRTPLLTAEQSGKRRVASFELSEDGTLVGDVREFQSGNFASEWREQNRNVNDARREEALREELKQRFADFTLSGVSFTASDDLSKSVRTVYHIVIPNYAQRTGKRLFLQPDYFASGFESRFTESIRHNPIYFEFPWSEVDSISLKLPEGFELDHADAPGGIHAPPTCTYSIKIRIDKAKNTLLYDRQLAFGDKAMLVFDTKAYPLLKQVFDAMHQADNHLLTLKVADIAAASSPNKE
jgi:hypothetical protein